MSSSISDVVDNKQLFHRTTTSELHQKQQHQHLLQFLPTLPKNPLVSETARESDDARLQRQKDLVLPKSNVHSRIIIPPKSFANSLTSSPSSLINGFYSSPFDEERDYAAEVLREEENQQKEKQRKTAACFHALKDFSNAQGPLKNVLGQIYSVLHAAAYVPPTYKLEQDTTENEEEDLVYLDMLRKKNATVIEQGKEFFTLLRTTQRQVKDCEKEKKKFETKLGLEISIQKDLKNTLDALYVDLEQMREHHKKNQELLETERTAVNELELELEALTAQEANKKHEVEILEAQKEKKLVQLEEIRAKAVELEAVASAPMKKHVEEQKQRDYEDQLRRQLQVLLRKNNSLQNEIQDMTDKATSLDLQLQHDAHLVDQIEKEVIQAEAQRDELIKKVDETRSCRTPRPDWDEIIEEIPEIVSEPFQWDDDEEEEYEEETAEEYEQGSASTTIPSKTAGGASKKNTTRLIKEMLQWIERLQKHCGVDLHLSKIWHDVEEARVELNILHHQLDRAMRRYHGNQPSSSSSFSAIGVPIHESRRPAKPETILALGNSEEVPKFLKHTGRVTKRQMKKVELENIIRKVWNQKRRRQERSGIYMSLEDALYEKIKQKHGFQPLVAEWGYNILIALNMYVWDSEVELFLLCLTGAISDQVYDDQENMIQSCKEILMKLCNAYQSESFLKDKRVLLKDAIVTLRKFFPLKTSIQLQAIEKAIIRDIHKKKRAMTPATTGTATTTTGNATTAGETNETFLYIEDIFPSGLSYARGFFVKTIRTQHFKEIQDYFTSLVTNIYETKDQNKNGIVRLLQIQEAMLQIDLLADLNQINQQIQKTLGLKNKLQINWEQEMDYVMFLKEMNTKNVLKYTLNYDPKAEISWQKRPMRKHLMMVAAAKAITSFSTTTTTSRTAIESSEKIN